MTCASLIGFLISFSPSAVGPSPRTHQDESDIVAFADYGLTLKLPALESRSRVQLQGGSCKGEWTGRMGASNVRLRLHVLPNADYDFLEPEDVVETWRNSIRNPDVPDGEAKKVDFSFEPTRCVAGLVGSTPILACIRGTMQKRDATGEKGTLLLVGGLLSEHGWSLRADAWPALDEESAKSLASALEESVTYEGEMRDPLWTDEDAEVLWKRFAPESTLGKFRKPTRTKHFIVLTNSPSPGSFVKKLEGWFATIHKAVPVDELEGRRLLPVLLYHTDDDFQAFYRRYHKMEPKDEVREESVAIDYWVATSCDNDDDHEHLVDMTKQVLIVRHRAWGGCQWLRSGLREYIATKPKERTEGLRAIKKGKFTALEKLLDNEAWGTQNRELSEKGASDEADYWTQAALWIEFLRDGPWPEGSFQRFVRAAGSLRDGDQAGVGAVLESVYGLELAALEIKWVEYFSKR